MRQLKGAYGSECSHVLKQAALCVSTLSAPMHYAKNMHVAEREEKEQIEVVVIFLLH